MKDIALTKVIATLGPSSASTDVIRKLFRAGVDVFRLNCSHGTHAQLGQMIDRVRRVEKEEGVPLGILGDLCGPKIRVGKLPPEGVSLVPGKEVVLGPETRTQKRQIIPTTYKRLASDVTKGQSILLNDGLFELRVKAIEGKNVRCKVIAGGLLTSGKGINLPQARVTAPALSAKDKADAQFLLERGVDILALSFVRTAGHVRTLKSFIKRQGFEAAVIAKIEKPQAIDELDPILHATDGIMVARGDLGVEVEPERVPILQKRLIRAANRHGKIVITATQMLESMIVNPRPTRAEATDVANAVFDGTDAVMLSGESAAGKYPVASATMMHRILSEAEDSPFFHRDRIGVEVEHADDVRSALALAAMQAAEACRAHAIAVFTLSGYTSRLIAKLRPACPIIALTPVQRTARTDSMVWGVTAILTDFHSTVDRMLASGKETLLQSNEVGPGKRVVLVSGSNFEGPDNLIQIVRLKRGD